MRLPSTQYVAGSLPAGWQRPTLQLVHRHLLELREGLAGPAMPHLHRPAVAATTNDLGRAEVQEGLQMLEAYTRPGSGSQLSAVGMAYPQLARASQRSLRILAAQAGMTDLRDASRGQNVTVLINPSYEPVRRDQRVRREEACFSVPGVAVHVMRWQEITLLLPGERPRRIGGTDAWILQHEIDHLDGILCTELALHQRAPLYYVPPEWKRTFFGGGFTPDWPTMPVEQYRALKSGAFDLASYARPQ